MKSIWQDGTALPEFPPFSGELKTEVLIIGGGLAGLLCAWRLEQAGVPYALIEANRICGGVTAGTTAKITVQHGLIYGTLLRRFGTEKARMYLEANAAAAREYEDICKRVDCDYRRRDAYVYATDRREKLERELRALEEIGYPAEFREKLPLPFPVAGAICFPNQAQFHPLRFAAAIAQERNIYEKTRALAFDGRSVVTDSGRITADKVIVATHFPLFNKHGSYFLKLYQHRSYVLGLSPVPELPGEYVDENRRGLSFRSFGDTLLLGGGAHRTGKRGGGWTELEALAKKYYPQAQVKYHWAAQDCMSLDGVPYIGQYSSRTPNLYVATGFNKWGITSSMAASMILTDLVLGRENPYAPVFSPSRTILRPQLLVNGVTAVGNLLTPTRPRCPHLGCALKWNPQEHSWDCSCHGSRFSVDGTVENNPANGNLKNPPTVL